MKVYLIEVGFNFYSPHETYPVSSVKRGHQLLQEHGWRKARGFKNSWENGEQTKYARFKLNGLSDKPLAVEIDTFVS